MGELPLPVEIIFSCAVCQATISEIYQNPEGDKGFRDGEHAGIEKPVTKLWLTECAHLTCGKHLEGGGVPFHRPDEPPRAPCPICSTERNDCEQKALYCIRGCLDGSFNERIPKNWFDTPPIKLDGSGKGMDAMRFHYLSLVRFGTNMLANFRKAQATAERFQKNNFEDAAAIQSLNCQIDVLRARVAELEECEKAFKPWKERGPKIKYYLGVFEEVTRENEKLREQLSAMGYAVPSWRYSFEHAVGSQPSDAQELERNLNRAHQHNENNEEQSRDTLPPNALDLDNVAQGGSSSSRTLTGPTLPMEPIANLHTNNAFLLNNKRKRNDYEDTVVQPISKSPRYVRGESRYLMPPPPLPLARSTRHNPQAREESWQVTNHTVDHSADQAARVQSGAELRDAQLQTLEDEVWQPISGPRRASHPVTMNTYRRPTSASAAPLPEEQKAVDYKDKENTFGEDRGFVEGPRLEVIDKIYNRLALAEDNSYEQKVQPSYDVEKSRRVERPSLTEYEYENPATQSSYVPEKYRGEPERHSHTSERQGAPLRSVNREPLRMFSQSALNSQITVPRLTSAAHHPHDIPIHKNRQQVNLSSSPRRSEPFVPLTPSPQGNSAGAFLQKESVISPFFRRTGAIQYSGPVRIPDRQQSSTSISARNPTQDYGMLPPPSKSITSAHRGLNSLSSSSKPREPPSHRPIYTPAHYDTSHSFLAPSTPRNALGLFQRPDAVSVPSSPYFSKNQFPPHPSISTRPNYFARPIGPLPSSTPSIRSNIYPQVQKPAHRVTSRTSTAFRNHTFGGSGSRSGISRPSREWARSSSNLQLNDLIGKDERAGKDSLYSTTSGRRSVRR